MQYRRGPLLLALYTTNTASRCLCPSTGQPTVSCAQTRYIPNHPGYRFRGAAAVRRCATSSFYAALRLTSRKYNVRDNLSSITQNNQTSHLRRNELLGENVYSEYTITNHITTARRLRRSSQLHSLGGTYTHAKPYLNSSFAPFTYIELFIPRAKTT